MLSAMVRKQPANSLSFYPTTGDGGGRCGGCVSGRFNLENHRDVPLEAPLAPGSSERPALVRARHEPLFPRSSGLSPRRSPLRGDDEANGPRAGLLHVLWPALRQSPREIARSPRLSRDCPGVRPSHGGGPRGVAAMAGRTEQPQRTSRQRPTSTGIVGTAASTCPVPHGRHVVWQLDKSAGGRQQPPTAACPRTGRTSRGTPR